MNKKDLLLLRLDEIGKSVEKSGHGLAVIGLGSVGREIHRLDDFSDLDFFVIVENGFKQLFIEDLRWLSSIAPLVYQFRNTVDGYKVLFEDGAFCEFAVFEQPELRHIPFAPGKIIWKRESVEESIAVPVKISGPPELRSVDWLIGEAITNLYVGLCRYHRGEKLSAARFVQNYAVDRVIELFEMNAKAAEVDRDVYSSERRIEQRYPAFAKVLPTFVQGYERTPESALAILEYVSGMHEINKAMFSVIRDLCRRDRLSEAAAG